MKRLVFTQAFFISFASKYQFLILVKTQFLERLMLFREVTLPNPRHRPLLRRHHRLQLRPHLHR